MKRAIVGYAVVALSIGLGAGFPAPAAGQDYEADELVRVPSSGYDLDVEVWVDRGEAATYATGQEVNVRFRANRDCYVVIYDIDTDGFLHLLFPDDPYDSGYVEGGHIYRLPDHDARYSLVAEGPPGVEYIAAVAADYPLTRRLPWYLANEYESAGYRGHHDLEATVDDVGAVRGDPFVAMRDIAYDILPEVCAEEGYDTDYTYFHVSGRYSHPRYVCYDCHGRASWFDPYDDVCTVVDIRVDLDWSFVRHPTFYYVGPRFWYWRRYDCPAFYVSVPQFWCSLYPRHRFFDHFYFGLHRVGVWYERRGYSYPPARYHGRPGMWERGYSGRYPDRPGYGKPPRHNIMEKGVGSSGNKRHYSRGKTPTYKPAEVRKPQRLAQPDVDTRGTRSGPKSGVVRGKEGGKARTKGIEPGSKNPDKPKAKVSRRGKGGDEKAGVKVLKEISSDREKPRAGVLREKDGGRVKTKAIKGKPTTGSKAKVSRLSGGDRGKSKATKQKTETRVKTKVKLTKRGDAGPSKSKAKVTKSKAKSGSKSQAKAKVSRKTADRGKSKAKVTKSKAKSGSESKAKAKVKKSGKVKKGGDKARSSKKSAKKAR